MIPDQGQAFQQILLERLDIRMQNWTLPKPHALCPPPNLKINHV